MLVGFLADREHSHPHSLGPVDGHILAKKMQMSGLGLGISVNKPHFNGHNIYRLRFQFRV